VISWFDASLQQMVALAVLMPIVASMGGNAGTQTMTVSVRALATRELGPVNLTRFVLRETTVGLLSSTVFVTTVTDVVGFFSFLGLATVLLL
jgi:magnesium transporter